MAKKSIVERQKKREKLVKLKWNKRQELKKLSLSPDATEEERHDARVALNKLPKNSCPARLRNRCKLTGRGRGYLSKFGISRLCFREFALGALIPGITKSSW